MNHRCCIRIEGWIVITELVMYNRKYSICTENHALRNEESTDSLAFFLRTDGKSSCLQPGNKSSLIFVLMEAGKFMTKP